MAEKRRQNRYGFQTDYEGFIEKFKTQKTTDECYTPPAVYDIVLDYMKRRFAIPDSAPIVRPFYPGGDYQSFDYPPGCVVVDNPPFSVTAEIIDFYVLRDIPFVLFTNGLTYGHHVGKNGVGVVVPVSKIVYENGAVVNTAFLVRGFAGVNLVEVDAGLGEAIKTVNLRKWKRAENREQKILPPPEVCTCAMFETVGRHAPGKRFVVSFDQGRAVKFCGGCEIFGSGILLTADKQKERMEICRKRDSMVKQAVLTDVERVFYERGWQDWMTLTKHNTRIARAGHEDEYHVSKRKSDNLGPSGDRAEQPEFDFGQGGGL